MTPEQEALRILALERYKILDTPEDEVFDRITRLASTLLKTPVAIVSLVDKERIWFKSEHGLTLKQVKREPGLCASAILGYAPYIVENARLDPRTSANSLVTGDIGLQFYAGVPLKTYDKFNLGTLCCLDFEPRTLAAHEIELLETLGDLVMEQMELRMSARFIEHLRQELLLSNEELARQKNLLEYELDMAKNVYAKVIDFNLSALHGLDYKVQPMETVGGDFFLPYHSADSQCIYLMFGDLTGHGLQAALSVLLIADTFEEVCASNPSVEQIATEINAKMCKVLPRGLFCAAIIIKVDKAAATFTIWHGGLPEAYLLNAQGKISQTLISNNFALGVLPDQDFANSATHHPLSNYASLIVFSDGINEQFSPTGQAFGYAAIKQALQETPPQQKRIDYVLEKLRKHQQDTPQTDDISIFELHFEKIIHSCKPEPKDSKSLRR